MFRVEDELGPKLAVIIRLVRNCALGRMIQYSTTVAFSRTCDYWIPRPRGV
jgi:hypothetical protein